MLEKGGSLVGELYTLRAGLSVVAQEKQIVDGILNNAKRNRANDTEREKDIVTNAEISVDNSKDQIRAYNNSLNSNKRIARISELVKHWIFIILAILHILVMIAVVAVFVYILGMGIFSIILEERSVSEATLDLFVNKLYPLAFRPDEYVKGGWGLNLWAGIIFGNIIAWIVWLAITILIEIGLGRLFNENTVDKVESSVSLSDYFKAKKEIRRLKKYIVEENANLNNLKNQLNITKAEADKKIDGINRQFKEECDKALSHVRAAIAIIKSLNQSFAYLIDMRDWENLDLIIYSIETRRADNIKEALRIVDSERRANRIVAAVQHASMEICRAVNTGLSRLQNEMRQSFQALSNKIVLSTQILSNQLSEVNANVNLQSNYVAQLASEANMNRALVAQSNKTSAQLAEYAGQISSDTKYIADRLR